ncbi:MAG TPA: ribonuclease P protein component [Allosphingosinicella sp.]
MPPPATLTRRADFLAANRGRRAPMPGFVLLVRPRADDGDTSMRLGITVTKKIGNAVVRNRMKRRFRALAREVLPEAGMPGADHVLIGRSGGVERDFSALREDLFKALRKLAGGAGAANRASTGSALAVKGGPVGNEGLPPTASPEPVEGRIAERGPST